MRATPFHLHRERGAHHEHWKQSFEVGGFVPDQKQQMRIRLKALVVDVRSGAWKMLTPEAHSDASYNSGFSRESGDQKLVNALKQKGYKSLADDLVK